MKTLTWTSLLLVVLLVTLSAYLRLAHSGVGCADWPACYAQIGEPQAQATLASAEDAYRKLVDESGRALAWATPLHRGVASVLGILVFALFALSLFRKRHRLVSAALLGLTVYLAIIGIRSGGLHDPGIVIGNLVGGFGMLALLGWLAFADSERGHGPPIVSVLAALAALALAGQIVLGGLTSANFAALSCRTLPDCHGGWWPGPALAEALDLDRQHQVTPSGQAVGGEERIAIHRAHRLGALATWLLSLLAAGVAFVSNRRFRGVATAALLLVTLEMVVGISTVIADIPIGLALAHNALAGLALLCWLRLLALGTPWRTAPPG